MPPDRQGEFFHRYVLGVYDLYRRLVERFPDILFESCASGGARFDAGLLAWAPQAWTSDDTDAVERLRDPVGHVARLPAVVDGRPRVRGANHQTGAAHAARHPGGGGVVRAFGYELDPTTLPDDERAEVAAPDRLLPRRRDLLQCGRFLRLRSPFEGDGNETRLDGGRRATASHAVVGFYRELSRPLPVRNRIRLRGPRPGRDLPRHDVDGLVRGAPRTARARGRRADDVGLGIEPPDLPLPAGETARRRPHRPRRLQVPPVRPERS